MLGSQKALGVMQEQGLKEKILDEHQSMLLQNVREHIDGLVKAVKSEFKNYLMSYFSQNKFDNLDEIGSIIDILLNGITYEIDLQESNLVKPTSGGSKKVKNLPNSTVLYFIIPPNSFYENFEASLALKEDEKKELLDHLQKKI